MSEQEEQTVPNLLTPLVVASLAVSALLAVLGTLDAARDPGGDRLWGVLTVGGPVLATVVGVLGATFSGKGGPMPALRNVLLVPLVSGRCAPRPAPSRCISRRCTARSRRPGPPVTGSTTGSLLTPTARPVTGVDPPGRHLLGHAGGAGGRRGGHLAAAGAAASSRRGRAEHDEHLAGAAATNRRAVRTLALFLFLVFAVPTCFVVGSENARADGLLEAFTHLDDFLARPDRYWGDLVWVVGLLLVPLGLLAMFLTMIWQRPDRERRRAAGVPVGLDLTPWLPGQAPDQLAAGPVEEPGQPPEQGRGVSR